MSDSKANDTNLPILVLIRRGRKGRGFLVSAADDPTDVAACADGDEVGAAIVELLDDPDQARFDQSQVESGSSEADSTDEEQETYAAGDELEEYEGDEEGEDDEDEREPGVFDVDPEGDIATQLLVNLGRATLKKGQELSNNYRKKGSGKNRR
jgi:hypothetical protein